MLNGTIQRTKTGRKSKRVNVTEANNINFNDADQLQTEYDEIIKRIREDDCESIEEIINNQDMKFYLTENDLDYSLFKTCIIHKQLNLIK